MAETFKKGDRVRDNFLGMGTVNGPRGALGVSVLFDVTPPIEYNMGHNPATRPVAGLTKIVEGETPKFKVRLRKIVQYTKVVTIEAVSKAEAEKQAIARAGDVDWANRSAEVECDYVEQIAAPVKKAKVKNVNK